MLADVTKVDWEKLKVTFILEHSQTGISSQDWCNKYQLNYNTARRYIKTHVINKNIKQQVTSNQTGKSRKIPKRRGPPLGSKNALKHGGYSQCFYDGAGQIAEAASKEDVLILCRIRIHLVLSKILLITQKLKNSPPHDMAIKLYDSLFFTNLAIDKNIATIVSITKKISCQKLKN